MSLHEEASVNGETAFVFSDHLAQARSLLGDEHTQACVWVRMLF